MVNGRREQPTQNATIRPVRFILCATVVFLLQVSVAHRFSYGMLRLDLLYLLCAFLALQVTARGALWSALLLGVLRDLASSGRLGASALVMVLVTSGLLGLRDYFYRDRIVINVVLVLLFVLFCGAGEAAVVALADHAARWGYLLRCALGQAVLTALLSPVLFFFLDLVGLVEEDKPPVMM